MLKNWPGDIIFQRERPLMTSDIRVDKGSTMAPKIGRYRIVQGRYVGQKWPKNVGRCNERPKTPIGHIQKCVPILSPDRLEHLLLIFLSLRTFFLKFFNKNVYSESEKNNQRLVINQQACKGMHPRPNFLSPSLIFPYILLNLRKKWWKTHAILILFTSQINQWRCLLIFTNDITFLIRIKIKSLGAGPRVESSLTEIDKKCWLPIY